MEEKTIFHVHSYRGKHASQEQEEEYIKKAIELGATKIVFTDHAPFPGNPFLKRMSIKELPEYVTVLQGLKEKYVGILEIKIGLEIEFVPTYREYYQALLNKWDMDILLLGEHFSLLPDGRYTFEMSEKNLEARALANGMIAGMETGLFQVVAHPDQIFRRMKKWNAEMDAISKEIKECAASTGVLLEKNIGNMLERKKRVYRKEFWEELPDKLQIIYGVDAHSVTEMEENFCAQKKMSSH